MWDKQQQLEQLVGFDLRADYVALMQSYPERLRDVARTDDGSDTEGFVHTVELMSDLEDVLDVNQEVRSGPVMDPEGNDFFWPDQLLAIGENGEGDYYSIDLANEYKGVIFFDHQTMEFEEITDSLDEYVELLLESFGA